MATDWRWIFLPWTYLLLVSCRLACLSNYLTLSLCVCLEGLCHLRTRLLSKIVSVSPSHSLLLSSTNSLLIDYWLLPTYHCCWQRQCIFFFISTLVCFVSSFVPSFCTANVHLSTRCCVSAPHCRSDCFWDHLQEKLFASDDDVNADGRCPLPVATGDHETILCFWYYTLSLHFLLLVSNSYLKLIGI